MNIKAHPETQAVDGTALTRPVVRIATPADLDALVRIELHAFRDVYGDSVASSTVQTIREKNQQRLELLGPWAKVLESVNGDVCGVFIVCPTHLDLTAFMTTHRDMTDTETIRSAYDEHGKAVYVINLAVVRDGDSPHNVFDLFAEALASYGERGIEHVYMYSRLPGLTRWLRKRFTAAQITELPPAQRDDLAEQYWRSTSLRRGVRRAADPLLNMYLGIGFEPLCLVPDHWPVDKSSLGYGVIGNIAVTSLSHETFVEASKKLWLVPGATMDHRSAGTSAAD